MATGYVVEWFGAATFIGGVVQAPRGMPAKVQAVDFTSGSAACAEAIEPSTGLVGLLVDEAAHFAGGATATTDDAPIGAEQYLFFVPSGPAATIAFVARA